MKTPEIFYIDKMMESLSGRLQFSSLSHEFSSEDNMHVIDLVGQDVESLDAEQWAILYTEMVNNFEEKFSDKCLLLVREGKLARISQVQARRFIPAMKSVNELSQEWDNISVSPNFVYEVHPFKKEKGRKRRVIHFVDSFRSTEFNFTAESVPVYAGTDSFCDVL